VITVVTSLFDGSNFGIPHTTGVYDPSWVDKLYRGFKRNSTIPFEMVCLVDRDYNFKEPIRPVKFIEQNNTIAGWSVLLEAYRPDLTNDWRIVVGLDTIIVDNVNCYLEPDKDFALVRDPYSFEPYVSQYPQFKNEVCNALSWCSPNSAQIIWDVWTNQKQWVYENCKLPPWDTVSEMVLLRKLFNEKNRVPLLDCIHKGVYSYRCHILNDPKLLQSARIVYFHGDIKPHQIGKYEFDNQLIKHWK